MNDELADLSEFADARILVVDDLYANTLLLRQLLNRVGLKHLSLINDSREVPKFLAETTPDLVLLDLHMPHVDGFEVLDTMKRHAAGRFLPVLVLTADTTRDAAYRALQLGADDFLIKPFDNAETVLRVKNLLRTQSAYQELRRHNATMRDHLAAVDRTRAAQEEPWELRRSRIEATLADGGLRAVYQPFVDVDSEETVGYEALARFDAEPARGPDRWFDEADGVGLGVELELLAARSALAQMPQLEPHHFLAINASPSLVLAGLHALLGDGIDWTRVVVELTEHVPIEDYSAIRLALDSLRNEGARLSIDDTGAGYASMRHILNLEPDFAKLDISLCRGIDRDPARRALAAALVAFARDTDCAVIAEGIETAQEFATLREIGVQIGQGYFLGRPDSLPVTSIPVLAKSD